MVFRPYLLAPISCFPGGLSVQQSKAKSHLLSKHFLSCRFLSPYPTTLPHSLLSVYIPNLFNFFLLSLYCICIHFREAKEPREMVWTFIHWYKDPPPLSRVVRTVHMDRCLKEKKTLSLSGSVWISWWKLGWDGCCICVLKQKKCYHLYFTRIL